MTREELELLRQKLIDEGLSGKKLDAAMQPLECWFKKVNDD